MELLGWIQTSNIEEIKRFLGEYEANDYDLNAEDNEAAKHRSIILGDTMLGGLNALHWAVESKQIEICDLLLTKHPTLLNKGDSKDATPLHYAALNGDMDILMYLIEKGARIASDQSGETPLHLAALNGHYKAVKYLVEMGSDVNSQTSSGSTPLHYACLNKKYDIVGYLLSLPYIDRDITDSQGNTATIIAANSKDKTLLNYFEDDKREMMIKLKILEDRVNVLEDNIIEANARHEEDQRTVAKAYKKLTETETELKNSYSELATVREASSNAIYNNELIINLKKQLAEANARIDELEKENNRVNNSSAQIQKDMMNNLSNAHRSLSNLITLFETTNLAILESKNSLESITTFMSGKEKVNETEDNIINKNENENSNIKDSIMTDYLQYNDNIKPNDVDDYNMQVESKDFEFSHNQYGHTYDFQQAYDSNFKNYYN